MISLVVLLSYLGSNLKGWFSLFILYISFFLIEIKIFIFFQSYHDSHSFIFSLLNNEKKPYKAVASCKTDSICISRDTCIIFGVCTDDDRGHDLILEGNSNNWKETGYWPSSCINRSHNSFICPEQQLALAGCNDIYLEDNFKTLSFTCFQTDEIEIFQLINLKRKKY